MKLSLFRQEHSHSCIPACIRIVLNHWGRRHTEAELSSACGSISGLGTLPEKAVEGMERMKKKGI